MPRRRLAAPAAAMTTRRWKTSSTRSRSTWLNLIPIPGSDRLGRSRNDPVKQSQSTGAIFPVCVGLFRKTGVRSEEHTSELQSLMRISYAVFCLKKQTNQRIYILQKHE